MMASQERLGRNKTILADFSYLSLLQVFVILFPLLACPYLLWVIGLELYDVIILAQSMINCISLVINFGFNMSGTRNTATYRQDRARLSRIVTSIYWCKFILWPVYLVPYLSVISMVPFFEDHYWVYILSFLLTSNEFMLPIWFSQGIEKMRYITSVDLSARLLFVVAILLFTHRQEDYLLVPLLNGIGAILTGCLSLYILLRKERVRFSLIPVRELRSTYKESLSLFVPILSTQIYVNVNKLVIGPFLGMSKISIYDMADKVLFLMKLPASMIAQTVFPKISREQNIRSINYVMFLSVGIALLFYISMFFGSDWLVYPPAGEHMEEASVVIRLLGISAILTSINGFFGGNRLVPLGYSFMYMRVMIGNYLFFLTAIGLLWLAESIIVYTVTVMVVGMEMFCFVLLVYRNWQLGLLGVKR